MTKEKKTKVTETSAVKKKLEDLNNKYKEKVERRNVLVKEVRAIDEELQKLVGAVTSLREVEAELTKDSVVEEK